MKNNVNISQKTGLIGLFGCPVGHSMSPKIQNELIKILGHDVVYLAFHVESERLKSGVEGIRALGMKGINVTAPHKTKIIEYLDGLDEEASRYGAVNVVKNANGKLIGYNTDIRGLCTFLESNDVGLSGKNILILGAGGLAKSLCAGLLCENPKSVTLLNRNLEKAEVIAAEIFEKFGFAIHTHLSGSAYDVVINATSAGMHPNIDSAALDDLTNIIDATTILFDAVYSPGTTLLMKQAAAVGAKTFNGFGMLIYQAILAYEIFMDTQISSEVKKDFFKYINDVQFSRKE